MKESKMNYSAFKKIHFKILTNTEFHFYKASAI